MFVFENSWHFRLSFAIRLSLGLALGFLAWVVLMRMEIDQQLNNRLLGFESDARRGELTIVRRFNELTREDNEARELIMLRVGELASDQENIRQAGLRAPFSLESVLTSLVEIICVGSDKKHQYYSGSGTVIDKSGLILTNHHVLIGDDGTLIRLCGVGVSSDASRPPKIGLLARAVAVDADGDLALLRVTTRLDGSPTASDMAALDISQTATVAGTMKIGDPVYIGGYPSVGADTLTITEGVIAGRVGDSLLKTSAYIDSGASGGAVFDSRGRFVGVPTAAVRGEIGGSLGYLIDGTAVQRFMDEFHDKKNLVTPEPLRN